MGMIRNRRSNTPTTSGTDMRLTVFDRLAQQFSTEFYKNSTLGENPEPEFEVQAFRQDGAPTAIVYISLRLKEGMVGVMLSSSEARLLAEALDVAAFEADGIDGLVARWT